jgi:hypothetical protein
MDGLLKGNGGIGSGIDTAAVSPTTALALVGLLKPPQK